METKVILDTNILINAFRRDLESVDFLSRKQYRFILSDVTIMELLAGSRSVERRKEIERSLEFYGRAPINERVINTAMSLIKRYSVRKRNIHIPDILIAATAVHYKLPLKSFNKKDFEFIEEVELL
jgi:predicted nucleic acid-binding protein